MMKRLVRHLWPTSLSGRVMLILFTGLAVAHVLSFWLVVIERSMVMRDAMVSYMAQDVATAVAILERVPPRERSAWLPRLARRNFEFKLDDAPMVVAASEVSLAIPVVTAVATALNPARDVQGVAPVLPGTLMRVQLRLTDGTPLAVDLLEPRLEVSPWVLAVLATQLMMLGAASWLAVRLVTKPLRQLADAADALAPTQGGAPLLENGPREVARAAVAFNAMQQRIQAHLAERMQILAAVSHDLQTPITRLRLRADLLDDVALRDKLLADLAQMQSLVEEGIQYARSAQASNEPQQLVDIDALLDSIACDYADAGKPVCVTGDVAGRLPTRPQALRRLMCNLVDNAHKFAGDAQFAVKRSSQAISISVLDRGPGIPDGELGAVMQPFYRLENSRGRDTGGTGLGLAIAQELALRLGGHLTLSRREGGGLAATLELSIGSCGTHDILGSGCSGAC
jgi:signal transduction histidine kinase